MKLGEAKMVKEQLVAELNTSDAAQYEAE
jgi:hypothetical protein